MAHPGAHHGPVRVLLVAPSFGAYGGMEAFVLAVAESLRSDRRFAVRICFKRTSGFVLNPSLVRACAPFTVEFVRKASAALWSAIAWADLVHAQNASPDTIAIAVLLRRALVVPTGRGIRSLTWRVASRAAAARWYNSEYCWANWEQGRRRNGSAKVPTVARLSNVWVDPSSPRGFLFLGRLTEGKGVEVLVDAYRRAALNPDVWPLTIAGDGPLRTPLAKRLAEDGSRGIHLAGFVEGDDKDRALAGAKWLVAPSHCREAFGLVVIEARSVGVPCIVSTDGGLPEAAGRDALLCEPAHVESLAGELCHAANMTDSEYCERSKRARADLERDLLPPTFYADSYLQVLKERHR